MIDNTPQIFKIANEVNNLGEADEVGEPNIRLLCVGVSTEHSKGYEELWAKGIFIDYYLY